jgi:hypothetical protein
MHKRKPRHVSVRQLSQCTGFRTLFPKGISPVYYRRKLILAVLQRFGGRLPRLDFQKVFFHFNDLREEPVYEFVPYKYGGFSFQSYADMRTMCKYGQIADVDGLWQKADGADYIAQLTETDANLLEATFEELGHLHGSELLRHQYLHHPYYAINSEIAAQHLSKDELAVVQQSVPSHEGRAFFTIGYEGRSIENYMNALIRNGIRALVDVRRNPFSMKYGFSRKQLLDICSKLGIEYVHIPELGIESGRRKGLKSNVMNGDEAYAVLFSEYESELAATGEPFLNRLHDIFEQKQRIAITCFESDPLCCHRHKVAEAFQRLFDPTLTVSHI